MLKEILSFVLFILASAGMAHILVDGSIFNPFKDWLYRRKWTKLLEMLNCYQCSGFWAGLTIALALYFSHRWPWLEFFAYACAGSFISNFGAVLISWFNVGAARNINE